MRKLFSDFKWHLDRGKHNEIPTCCTVWFFIRLKIRWHDLPPLRWIWHKTTKSNYIRCSICALRGINIDVHECIPDCGWYYESQQRAEKG